MNDLDLDFSRTNERAKYGRILDVRFNEINSIYPAISMVMTSERGVGLTEGRS
jgi:hypothetical protein